ncbi:hypothetical protein DE146DRAFT_737499 [Phaeosphaeria sp. MPI-PUGE-AT-0046c]|nr:hypothetical protein DE146DRAFT_737499 [Phaeosphaeria sp. MPI-PUGE-AT-0046c]
MSSTSAMTTLKYPFTNYQSQSPLFGVLPGEIRNEIFALALMPYEDDAATYPQDSYWFRPGFSAPSKSRSELLRTCKAAYAEGQKVFLRDLEWAFWFNRGPYQRTGNGCCMRFFNALSPQAAEALQKVRFFTQLYWLENGHGMRQMFRMPTFRPASLTITIRYSDWWWWENDEPLRMDESWLKEFVGTPGLRELRVEYETRVPKKGEMMSIVQRNKKYKLPIRREGGNMDEWEGYLSAEKTDLKEWTWKGTSKLGGREWGHLAKSDVVEYVVVTDTWRFVEGWVSPEDLGRHETGEEYSDLMGHEMARDLMEDEMMFYNHDNSFQDSDNDDDSDMGSDEDVEDDDEEVDDEADEEVDEEDDESRASREGVVDYQQNI